jgi:hypothetical protein
LVLLAKSKVIGDVGVEAGVTALMLDDAAAVDINPAVAVHAVEC